MHGMVIINKQNKKNSELPNKYDIALQHIEESNIL